MKEEFAYLGNTSSMRLARQLQYRSFDLSTLPCCLNARYAFRLVVYKYARVFYDKLSLLFSDAWDIN